MANLSRDVQEFIKRDCLWLRRRDAVLERVSFQQFHRNEGLPLVLFDLVNRADVGMIQSRCCLRLTFKALERELIIGHPFRQKLERHMTAQFEIFRLEDHPHTAAPDDLEYAIVGDFLPDQVAAEFRHWLRAGGICRWEPGRWFQLLNADQQAISAPRQCFDVLRLARRIAQRFPQNSDRHVYAVVEIDDGAAGPERSLDFLAGYDLAFTFNQHSQNLERLFPQKSFD